MAKARNPRAGFTLIELLVVVAIIGILMAIAIPSFTGQQGKAFDQRVRSDARNAANAQEAYFVDNAEYYSGDCSGLPGVQLSENVSCDTTATSPTTFTITTTHPSANVDCTWANDTSPNLICS